jgi:hypothetical protein
MLARSATFLHKGHMMMACDASIDLLASADDAEAAVAVCAAVLNAAADRVETTASSFPDARRVRGQ